MIAGPSRRIASFIRTIFFATILVMGTYFIFNIVQAQNVKTDHRVAPAYTLFEKEILAPINIAKTLAEAGTFERFFGQDEPSIEPLLKELRTLENKLGYAVHLVHEKSKKQYNSDGSVSDLTDDDVSWYSKSNNDVTIKIQSTHRNPDSLNLYTAVRQLDGDGNILGFVGIGKSLTDFNVTFDEFRTRYGYDVIFVDTNKQIVLSSFDSLSPENSTVQIGEISVKNLDDIEWFNNFSESTDNHERAAKVVYSSNGEFLVSQLSLKNLNWELYLVTPLTPPLAEVNFSYAAYLGIGIVTFLLVYRLIQRLLESYMNRVSHKVNRDGLCQLPNSEHANFFFSVQRKKHRQISVIMIEIAELSKIKLMHGKPTFNRALQEISSVLRHTIKGNKLAVRWQEDAFVVVVPGVDENVEDVAEQCRFCIEYHQFYFGGSTLQLTPIMGIHTSRKLTDSFELIVAQAKKTLNEAKTSDKNTFPHAA